MVDVTAKLAAWIEEAVEYVNSETRSPSLEREGRALLAAYEQALAATPAPIGGPPHGYESTTPAYIRWVSPERYAKFSPKVQAWYRPYWLAATPAPAPKPCLVTGDCKHGNWCSEVYCQEHCRFVGAATPAPAPQAEPSAWLVLDKDGSLVHAAAWREAAHEHINDAINEHGITEAARWVVRPAFTAPVPATPAPAPLTLDEIIKLAAIEFPSKQWQSVEHLVRAVERAHGIGQGKEAGNG